MESTDTIELRIASLEKQCADRFDPVRFRYITSLAKRAREKSEPVRRIVEQKVHGAIDAYQARLDTARDHFRKIVARLSFAYPDAADMLQALFEKCDFQSIKQNEARLSRRDASRPLAVLTKQWSQNAQLDKNDKARLTLYERIRRQEEEILRSVCKESREAGTMASDGTMELASFRFFKEALAEHHAEQLVNGAILDRPENPGHLNGQMLATRCLSAMRKLSPIYLSRFVAYLDGLFFLEEATTDVSRQGAKHAKRNRV